MSQQAAEEPMEEGGPASPGPPPLQDQNGMEVTAPVRKSAKAASLTAEAARKRAEKRKVEVTELNPHIQCQLCKGYLIDPVTVVECLHSFCKSCIIRHVESSKACPTCDIQIHKTKPLLSLRADKALQDIVYKVVPGLYRTEMQNRVKFYTRHPDAEPANPEDAGEVVDSLFFSPEDDISMSIEYFDFNAEPPKGGPDGLEAEKENPNRRFLQCPGSVTVQHLKKFIITKYGLDEKFVVDVIYRDDLLPEDNTLIDVAYSYHWRKTSPMRFYYRIYQKTKVLTRKRKSKKTKTNSKGQPSKKRRNIDATSALASVERKENGMDIDDESRKASTNLRTDSGEEKSRARVNGAKERPKGDGHKVNPPAEAVKPLKAGAGPIVKPVSGKPVVTKPGQNMPALHKSGQGKPVAGKAVQGKPAQKPTQGKPVPSKPVASSPTVSKPVASSPVVSKPVASSPVVSKPSGPMASKPVPSGPPVSKPAHTGPVASKPVLGKSAQAKTLSGKEAPKMRSSPPVTTASSNISKTPVTPTNTDSKKETGKLPGMSKTLGSVGTEAKVVQGKKALVQATRPVNKELKEVKDLPGLEVTPVNGHRAKNGEATKPAGEKEVVEISVEVSASDVKKVLEKKKAEKDARLTSNGEEKLYSNYSIVDQLKKGAAAASLARQKQASMMDFTRSSEALNAPKVPPTIQGLQPKVTAPGETNVLSAIVHSLAQKQQSLSQKIQAVTANPESGKDRRETASPGERKDGAEATKTLGTILAPGLAAKPAAEKLTAEKAQAPKLPTSTSIKPIESRKSPAPVDTSGSKGQQMLNFYKNNFPKTTTGPELKSTETLTKNIPAGTTVTVKTVDTRQPRSSPSTTPTSKSPSSSSSSAFRMNLSNSAGKQPPSPSSPYSPAAPQSPLMNPFMGSSMAMALAQQQYLNFSNQHAAMTAAAQMEQTANYIKAMQAAQITSSPVTTLAFTKPVTSSGLKIPQPASSFGTSRLQLKVNQDSPLPPASPPSGPGGRQLSPAPRPAHHSMPAMLPFHGVKKVQALPKSAAQTRNIPSLLARPPLPLVAPTAPAQPAKKAAAPTTILHSTLKGPTAPQPTSLKKLVADLNTAQQKNMKTENLLSTIKKNNENKLLSEAKKSFVGLDIRPVEAKKPSGVTTS